VAQLIQFLPCSFIIPQFLLFSISISNFIYNSANTIPRISYQPENLLHKFSEGLEPTASLKVKLEQRAEYEHGAVRVYLKLESELLAGGEHYLNGQVLSHS
jgi:hypothetical protein